MEIKIRDGQIWDAHGQQLSGVAKSALAQANGYETILQMVQECKGMVLDVDRDTMKIMFARAA